MEGKLIGVTVNGETIPCNKAGSIELVRTPHLVGGCTFPVQDGLDLKKGDEIKNLEIDGDVYPLAVVRSITDGLVNLDLYL